MMASAKVSHCQNTHDAWRMLRLCNFVAHCTALLYHITVEVDLALLPPEARTFIPEGATAEINCTADSSQSPAWTIQLPGQSLPLQFPVGRSRMTLNNRGFYELPELDSGVTRIIRLLLNNTMNNNGSVIGCIDTDSGNTIVQTSLHIYGIIKANV